MKRYCTKCGKELVKERVVGFSRVSGEAIAEYSCPSYLKDIKELKKRLKLVESKATERHLSKENKTSFWTKLTTGKEFKYTLSELKFFEEQKCYVGIGVIRAGLLGIVDSLENKVIHDHSIKYKVTDEKNEGLKTTKE